MIIKYNINFFQATFHAEDLSFSNGSKFSQLTGPIKIGPLNDVIKPESMSMDFDFKTRDVFYDNLFQIGAFRMEITSPGTLTLFYGVAENLILSENIRPNVTYHIHFSLYRLGTGF